jgi:superfamily II DNA or RNA helicase
VIELWQHQTEARYQINTLLNASRSPVFVSPTGTGKSRTIAAVIKDRISLGRRVYLLVPTDEVFNQWIKEFISWGLNPGTINQNGFQGRNRGVYVCMYISLSNMLPYLPEYAYPDEIAIDELHHFPTNTIEKIQKYFSGSNWFGCTATLGRLDGKGFDNIFTDIVETITMKEAIEKKYLAKPLVIVPKIYLDKIDIINGEFDPTQQLAELGKTQIIGNVIENYATVFQGKQVIVACCNFDHAKDMAEAFCRAGWRFKHIHGNLPKHERRKMIYEIRKGIINGLTTYAVGTEGADIKGLHGLIWLRRTLSLIVYLQFIGRCLRSSPGKEYGIILDPVGNLFIHGWPETRRKWSLKGFAPNDARALIDGNLAATMRICPFCGVANAADNRVCHFCGRDLDSDEAKQARKRKLPAMVDGELVAVESDGKAEEIRRRSERIKAEQEKEEEKKNEEEKRRMQEAMEITPEEKVEILKRDLFGSDSRKKFREAVRDWL